MKKVLCIGSVTTDIIVNPAESIPEPGTLRSVDSITAHVGGCASNAAVDLGRLGVPVTLSCRVGQDIFGDFVKKNSADAGVDISGVVSSGDIATTVSVACIRSDGERSFLYSPASAAQFTEEDIPDALLDKCDIVFVAGAMLLTAFDGEPCARLLARARRKGKLTVMDTAWDFQNIWLPKIAPSLPHLDIFMPSVEEAEKLTGLTEYDDIADFFIDRGAKNIILKLGKDGAYIHEDGVEPYILPTYKKYKAVDSTGAGDAFCAGFLCGIARGWSFANSARMGNAVGTHCVMKIGATTGIPPVEEILDFMKREAL